MASTINSPPSGVPKRKPLASVAVPPPIADANSDLEKTTEPVILVPTTAPPAPKHKLTQWQQLRQRWSQFSTKKKRIIIGALIATLALLALIIGLAVGLTKRHGKG